MLLRVADLAEAAHSALPGGVADGLQVGLGFQLTSVLGTLPPGLALQMDLRFVGVDHLCVDVLNVGLHVIVFAGQTPISPTLSDSKAEVNS